jgi:hypothetical protein
MVCLRHAFFTTRSEDCVVLCCVCCVCCVCCAGFSAQSVFFPLYIATFNALWAAYPTLGYGLFEQVSIHMWT